MSQRKSWLPREGFTLDVLVTIAKQTLFNPTLTVPLWLLTRHTNSGRGYALDHSQAVKYLKFLVYMGVARSLNGALNKGAQNTFTRASPDWNKEFVLITGGSDGIGKLLVKMFAARGVKTVIFDVQDPTFELTNPNTYFVKVDLTDPDALKSACDLVKVQYGNPSVLILNAGVINRHSIIDLPDHLLRRVFDLNTLSHYRLAREFLPAMIRANHGLVCSTASLAAWVTSPGMVDYGSTKASVVTFHEGLTAELATWHKAPAIRTICICPNFVDTKLSDGFLNDSNFLNPTLAAETVAEAQFDKIWRWEGGMVSLQQYQKNIALVLRSCPYWIQNAVRNGLHRIMKGVADIEQERVRKLREQQEAQASESVIQVERAEAEPQIFA